LTFLGFEGREKVKKKSISHYLKQKELTDKDCLEYNFVVDDK